jgi:hypothetical protein
MTMIRRRRLPALMFAAGAVPAAFALGACGDREAEERKAFIEFLQTRIIARPGVRVPTLSPDDDKRFGRYAAHYAVIRDFNDALNKSISGPMSDLMGKGSIRSLQDLMQKRDSLATVREGAASLRRAVEQELAKADAARAALQQPDDLKAIYDAAYAKTVREPAGLFVEIFPALDRTLTAGQDMVTFLERNKDKVKISGNAIEVGDAKLKSELDALLARLAADGRAIQDAQRKLQAMIRG